MASTTARSASSRAPRLIAAAGVTLLASAGLATVAQTAQADTVGGASSGVVVAGGTASAGVAASYRAASGAEASIAYPDGNLYVSVRADGSGGHDASLVRRIDRAPGVQVVCRFERALTGSEFSVSPDFLHAVLHLASAPVATCDDGTSMTLPDTVTWTSSPGGIAWINGPSPSDDTWCLTLQEISINDPANPFGPAGVWADATAQVSTAGVAGPSGHGDFWYVFDADAGFDASTTPGIC